jgi:hypothetical protein
MVPIVLTALDGTTLPPLSALIDSGADESLFPVAFAQATGVNLATCAGVQGITAGGISQQYQAPNPLEATIMGKTVSLTAKFDPNLPVILLGREDFFRRFKVEFDQRHRRVRLTPY